MRFLVGFLFVLTLGVAGCDGSGGGESSGWFRQDIGPTNPLLGVSVVDANVATIVGFDTILRTTDGGATWVEQYPGSDMGGIARLIDVSFTDANNGTAVGDATILRTTDGGATWVEQDSGNVGGPLYSVSFTDTNNGTVVGSFGTILRTTDAGQTWISQRSREDEELDGVSFTDGNTGTVVGFRLMEGSPRILILRTTDGGANWIEREAAFGDVDGALRDVSFTDANNGTAIGWVEDRAVILRTTDGGATWVEQESGIGEQSLDEAPLLTLSRVCFTDTSNGTIVGSRGTILRTRDGGDTWVKQDSGTTAPLWSVSFSDANNGTAIGPSIILRTTGGGWGPFIETEPYCADKPDETPCVARDGAFGNCADGLCCYEVRDPITGEVLDIRCDESGGGGTGGTGGSGGTSGAGGGGVGGDGGSAGEPGGCVRDEDTATYDDLTYRNGAGVEVSGTQAASDIANDCVFGAIDSQPTNSGCPQEAQAVLICASTGCPPPTVEALATCVVDCTQDIIEQQTGSMLTEGCAACYGDSVACSAALCATSGCSNPTSPSCIRCRCENGCTPGFDRCSELPPSGDCG